MENRQADGLCSPLFGGSVGRPAGWLARGRVALEIRAEGTSTLTRKNGCWKRPSSGKPLVRRGNRPRAVRQVGSGTSQTGGQSGSRCQGGDILPPWAGGLVTAAPAQLAVSPEGSGAELPGSTP